MASHAMNRYFKITAPSQSPRYNLPVTVRTENLQGGLKVHRMVYVSLSKKKKELI